MKFSKIIWLYGMSDAGKTTLGLKLSSDLNYFFVDSDYFRRIRWVKPDFTFYGRIDYHNALRTQLRKLQQAEHEGIVVASITPYNIMREYNRKVFKEDYCEILIKCDLDILVERDSKGLYKKALDGEIENFTGISDVFEEGDPDIIINTGEYDLEEAYQLLCKEVEKWLSK